MMNLQRSMGEDGKADFKVSLKAFVKWLFPSAEYLKRFYYYCYKHPILVPAAWFHRWTFNKVPSILQLHVPSGFGQPCVCHDVL